MHKAPVTLRPAVLPTKRFIADSICTIAHKHPEPLFIPKLQSRFADFPWPFSLLTRGFSPWRPDAVIGTESALYAEYVLMQPPATHAPTYVGVFLLY